jgi:hypothetical protein
VLSSENYAIFAADIISLSSSSISKNNCDDFYVDIGCYRCRHYGVFREMQIVSGIKRKERRIPVWTISLYESYVLFAPPGITSDISSSP